MGLFSLFNGKAKKAIPQPVIPTIPNNYKTIDSYPEDVLVKISEEELDTRSMENEIKFKHNLEVLIKRAKREKRVDKFFIIREDDIFPEDWKWRPCSYFTSLELESTILSSSLRERIAEEKLPKIKLGNIEVPHNKEKINDELKNIDKTLGNVYMPSHFRSTKHFTINTPLGITGDYNLISPDKNFIIIDPIDNFLNSGYAYSVGYKDAYLDVAHEPLNISADAVVLIRKDKYDSLIENPTIAEQLKERRVIKFSGDEILAIDMVLTELGALPYRVGLDYAHYDETLEKILDSSIEGLAKRNNLHLNKSHSGALTPTGGHFSNYYDDRNFDYQKALNYFATFINNKFPEANFSFSFIYRADKVNVDNLINNVGVEKLLGAINEYNEMAIKKISEIKAEYLEDRKQITEEIHDLFISTIGLIDDYYMKDKKIENHEQLEENIQMFLQSRRVQEQVAYAKIIQSMINRKQSVNEETQNMNKTL